jgi:uncharacterized membrane protein YqaE (UPF0057 family)
MYKPLNTPLLQVTRANGVQGTVLLYFLAILIPFVPVFMRRGCHADLFINVLLCCLGWLPGVLHAWYIVSQTEKVPNSLGRPDGRRP